MAEPEDNEPKKSFKVEDRRRFAASGEARKAPAEPLTNDSPTSGTPPHAAAGPEIGFGSFVIGLTTQALIHLGEIVQPGEAAHAPDLEAARQLIDILSMLETKTRGNLDESEAALLKNALFDLRMRFVERTRPRS